jgi:hypothetical protein
LNEPCIWERRLIGGGYFLIIYSFVSSKIRNVSRYGSKNGGIISDASFIEAIFLSILKFYSIAWPLVVLQTGFLIAIFIILYRILEVICWMELIL